MTQFCDRFDAVHVTDDGQSAARWRVIPTPAVVSVNAALTVDLRAGNQWVIATPAPASNLDFEAQFLAGI